MSNFIIKCAYCGKEFIKIAKKQKYCSIECQKKRYCEIKKELREKVTVRNEKNKSVKNSTLCWKCKNACCGCEWSKYFIPVEGWVAIPTKIRLIDINNHYTESYQVISCPKFEKDIR